MDPAPKETTGQSDVYRPVFATDKTTRCAQHTSCILSAVCRQPCDCAGTALLIVRPHNAGWTGVGNRVPNQPMWQDGHVSHLLCTEQHFPCPHREFSVSLNACWWSLESVETPLVGIWFKSAESENVGLTSVSPASILKWELKSDASPYVIVGECQPSLNMWSWLELTEPQYESQSELKSDESPYVVGQNQPSLNMWLWLESTQSTRGCG